MSATSNTNGAPLADHFGQNKPLLSGSPSTQLIDAKYSVISQQEGLGPSASSALTPSPVQAQNEALHASSSSSSSCAIESQHAISAKFPPGTPPSSNPTPRQSPESSSPNSNPLPSNPTPPISPNDKRGDQEKSPGNFAQTSVPGDGPTWWNSFKQAIVEVDGGTQFEAELKKLCDPEAECSYFKEEDILVCAFRNSDRYKYFAMDEVLGLPVGKAARDWITAETDPTRSTMEERNYSILVFCSVKEKSCVALLLDKCLHHLGTLPGIDPAKEIVANGVRGGVFFDSRSKFPSKAFLLACLSESTKSHGCFIKFDKLSIACAPFEQCVPPFEADYQRIRRWLMQYFIERGLDISYCQEAFRDIRMNGYDLRATADHELMKQISEAGFGNFAAALSAAVIEARKEHLTWDMHILHFLSFPNYKLLIVMLVPMFWVVVFCVIACIWWLCV